MKILEYFENHIVEFTYIATILAIVIAIYLGFFF